MNFSGSLLSLPRVPAILVFLCLLPCLSAQVPESERNALIAFYQATGGPDWAHKENWLDPPGTEAMWYGVTVEGGHVTELDLRRNNLIGTLPNAIGDLRFVKYLNFYGVGDLFSSPNQLMGSIPSTIGNLSALEYFRIDGNEITAVPHEIGLLHNLETLHLSRNWLTGLPPGIGFLRSLTRLDLTDNKLTGLPPEIGNLPSIERFDLADNRLSGLPPEIGDLTSLDYLDLTDNELSSLPSEIGNLSNLTHLYLSSNQLIELPEEIGQLVNLTLLSLGGNLLTTLPDSMILMGSLLELAIGSNPMQRIPPVVGRIPALETLTIGDAEKGSIPPGLEVAQQIRELNLYGISIWPPGLFSLRNLQRLNVPRNRLNYIPPGIGNLTSLVALNLDDNPLAGSIPPELGNLSRLEALSLHGNHLSGSLPPELGFMQSLQGLAIYDTDISGSIPPELGNLLNLRSLVLRGNNLNGAIPPELGHLANLRYLGLHSNSLEGVIPGELGNLTNLTRLELSYNNLEGVIPTELGDLFELEYLLLTRNGLSGLIPPELGKLVNLNQLNLRANRLSGPVPSSLTNLSKLRTWSAHLDYNALYIDDPESGVALREIFGNFESTQTVVPIKLKTPEIGGSSVLFTWAPIAFQEFAGSYEILVGTNPGGPYDFAGRTKDKTESSIRLGGLDLGTTYYIVIRTITESHRRNPNRVTSEFSHELEVTTGSVQNAYFPLLVSDAESFTGFAVSNVASSDSTLEFRAFDSIGNQIPGITNPSLASISGQAHLARLGSEIFGYAPQSEQRGWALLTADGSPLGSLFLIGGDEKLDGGPAFGFPAQHFWFTRALVPASLWRGQAGSALIALANPSLDQVSVELTLWGDRHTPFVNTRNHLKTVRTIPPLGLLLENVSTLFENHGYQSGDLEVEVKSGEGVIGFEVLESSDENTIVGLSPSFDPVYTQLYSAQFATGPSLSTSLKLVNTGNEACQMTIRVVGNDGSELAESYQGEILSKHYFEKDVDKIFAFSQPSVVGSISVILDKLGVIGDVIIGERTSLRYASALSLQGRLFEEAIFSQVANTPYLFTGLALLNPHGGVADVTIEVFSASGQLTGEASLKLPGGHRLSKLLYELVPETRNQVEGYFVVRSSQPLAGQQIFGDYMQTFFAAVPPKILGVYALTP